jgi:FixJ family two-component response regulator
LGNCTLISVIDDDLSVRLATESLLRSFGWTVHTFACAEDYLNSLDVNDTSCLITDVQMPGMSGIELQSVVAARGYSTPVIFITAYAHDGIRARLLDVGAVCFLSKPFNDQSLVQCVNAALKGKTSPGSPFHPPGPLRNNQN